MPSFTIYKGEMGLQRENQILTRENAALKREYEALAKFCAENGIQGVRPVEQIASTAQQSVPGETFRSQMDGANCEVTIGAPGQGVPNRPTPNVQQPAVGQPMRPEIAARIQKRPGNAQQRQQAQPQQPLRMPNAAPAVSGMPSEAELLAAGIPLGPPGYAPQPGGGGMPQQVEDEAATRFSLMELGDRR